MGGKLTRKIGLERTEVWWGLKNLTFNFLRYLQSIYSINQLHESL
jgi:IS5 family transposase